ncbi:MAG TPA: AsmA-like C-terminal region-containing protein, partial [Pirellulales bacterium]|nr:AsmA-like C-terminal region-containing protein [Pirellulales bacterium]
RLPHPLTDLRATFRVNAKSLAVTELTAQSGPTTLKVASFVRTGHLPKSPFTLRAEGEHVVLDAQLLKLFPGCWQGTWQLFRPSGEVDVERLELNFDGERWRPRLLVRCVNVAFAYEDFPYRLEHGKGRIEFNDGLLTVDVTAYSDAEPVRIVGRVRNPGPEALVFWEIHGDSLRLDEKLFKALREPTGRVVRALNPRGTFSLFCRIGHDEGRNPALHKHVAIGLNRCSLKYDAFPYPLDNVRGSVVMNDDVWEFNELEGTNDTGRVTCQGRLFPSRRGHELVLNFEGRNVPLEEELRDALAVQSPGAARLWRDLKPRGTVDAESVLTLAPGDTIAEVWVTARPVCNEAANQFASIEPSYFPYRLEKLQGELTYERGSVKLERIRAEHRGTKLSAAGECDIDPLGGWRLRLDRCLVDHFRPTDREVLQALSGLLKKRLTDLAATGSLNLRGSLELSSAGQPGDPVSAGWDLNVEVQRGSLDFGIALEDIFGGARLVGGFDGRRFECHGELDFDSVTLKEHQLTELRGPFFVDDEVVLLGAAADRRRRDRSVPQGRSLTARLYGGLVRADGKITAGQGEYIVHCTLANADLARFAREAVAGQQRLTGLVSADVDFSGRGRGIHNLAGRGRVTLRDADLFQLPVLVALLKTLSGRPPSTTAFNTGDVDFRIEGEHVYLNRIDCKGDAISLRGKGELNFDRTIKLTFHTVLGHDDVRIPILDKLGAGASQQILLIHVGGTLDEPITRREPFPTLAQALEQLQPDPAPRAGAKPRGEKR